MSGRILVVDDEKNILVTLKRALELEGYVVDVAGGGKAALEKLRGVPFDLALLDVKMPDLDGLELLSRLRADGLDVPVVMMSGHGSAETALEATRRGAVDFLEKPIGTEKLLVTVANALRLHRLEDEARERRTREAARHAMVGDGPAMRRLRALIEKAAPTNARVLVVGERGTGKELVARAVHEGSRRRRAAYVRLNCAAVPAELIESELFGHEKGAFTGAVTARRGKFEAADGGTLFLDEIGDMPLEMQAKLLRVLQEGELERVGSSTGDVVRVDVRVVAATNQDLRAGIAQGKFRADLYDRLNVFPIEMPPLRARLEDIPALVKHAAAQAAADHGIKPREFTDEALDLFAHYDWPGNVRELRNTVERLLILAEGPAVTARDAGAALARARPAVDPRGYEGKLLKDALAAFERDFVTMTLDEHGWDYVKGAKALGLERSSLYRKTREHKIRRPAGLGPADDDET
jgi:DNA-binding NtrC family response regulator